MHILNKRVLLMLEKINLKPADVNPIVILPSVSHQLPDGRTLALPKVATAQFGNDSNKRTVCVYGHVDVQPAKLEDGWATEPYNLTDINGNNR